MDDLISRQAAIDAIEEYSDRLQMVNWQENPGVPYKAYALNWAVNTIRDLPSAHPEQRVNTLMVGMIMLQDMQIGLHMDGIFSRIIWGRLKLQHGCRSLLHGREKPMDKIDLYILLGAVVLLILPGAILLIGCLKVSSRWARWEEEEERRRNE